MYKVAKRLTNNIPHLTRLDLRPLLRPSQDILTETNKNGCIVGKSISNRPLFTIEKNRLERGWYMVEVLIESDTSYLETFFTIHHQSGRKSKQLNLSVRNGRMAKRLIWLARGEENISFSPAQNKCNFVIKRLTLVRVSMLFARNRMRARLSCRSLSVPSRLTYRWAYYDSTFNPNGVRVSYREWIKKVEPDLWPKLDGLTEVSFTILMPVDQSSNLDSIKRTVYSIISQKYKNWNLFIIPMEVLDRKIISKIKSLIGYNEKIRLIDRVNYRQSIEKILNKDTYYLMCPPRAVLANKALSCFEYILRKKPKAKIIYSDEDMLNSASRRSSPNFKSAWNPDLFYSINYIGEFVVFAPGLLEASSFSNLKNEMAWDYNLLLQILKKIKKPNDSIFHIPRILFHRFSDFNKDLYLESSKKILKRYFNDKGQRNVEVEYEKDQGALYVRWPILNENPLVSLLIPTRDMLPILKQCVESILKKTSYENYEILILDNQSKDPKTIEYLEYIKNFNKVRVIKYDQPFNYSAINNFGVKHAHGKIIGLINNDIEVISSNWLEEMVAHASRPNIGCVGAKLYYSDNRIQHAGVVIGLGGLAGHAHKFFKKSVMGYMNRLICTQNFSAVTAACLLLRKETYEKVGGLDEKNFEVAFNDVDLCLKVQKAGFRNLWTPFAEMYHHESISRGLDNTPEKRARFEREATCLKNRWRTHSGIDPYYSPFLTHKREDFSLGLNEDIKAPMFR
ncbi:glycosyltransferase family 2 protein [Microbulbifer sp. DLAB2-AA]|uniref:glycosyltransferase family 2 protein n=1 Tax=Microbulbifer sp. DLAB2-AA TaxID=3243394 RepID=UPI00403966AB